MDHFRLIFGLTWGGFGLMLGSVFLVLSIFIKKHSKRKEEHCIIQTMGTVVDIVSSYEQRRNGVGGNLYYPVVEYCVNGNLVTQRPGVGTNPCLYVIGQSIEVSYNPNMPGEMMLEGDKVLKKVGRIFGMVAYIIFGVGILVGGIIILSAIL